LESQYLINHHLIAFIARKERCQKDFVCADIYSLHFFLLDLVGNSLFWLSDSNLNGVIENESIGCFFNFLNVSEKNFYPGAPLEAITEEFGGILVIPVAKKVEGLG